MYLNPSSLRIFEARSGSSSTLFLRPLEVTSLQIWLFFKKNQSQSLDVIYFDTISAIFDNFLAFFSWLCASSMARQDQEWIFFSVKWRCHTISGYLLLTLRLRVRIRHGTQHSGTAEIFEGVNNFAQWVPARHSGLKEVETYPVFWFNRVCLHLCIGENRKKVILIILQCTTCIKGNNLPCSNQTF